MVAMSVGAPEAAAHVILPSARGSARTPVMGYVRGLRRIGDSASELEVLMADRCVSTLRVPCVPDAAAVLSEIPDSHQPLAVRIELGNGTGEEAMVCSCLAATSGGPERLRLSPPAALALFERGRHTLLILGPNRRS
jgi:hypothetical protein